MTICNYHHHNHHDHLSLLLSQPPWPSDIIITTTMTIWYCLQVCPYLCYTKLWISQLMGMQLKGSFRTVKAQGLNFKIGDRVLIKQHSIQWSQTAQILFIFHPSAIQLVNDQCPVFNHQLGKSIKSVGTWIDEEEDWYLSVSIFLLLEQV